MDKYKQELNRTVSFPTINRNGPGMRGVVFGPNDPPGGFGGMPDFNGGEDMGGDDDLGGGLDGLAGDDDDGAGDDDGVDFSDFLDAFEGDSIEDLDDTKPFEIGGFTDASPEKVKELENDIRRTIANISVPDNMIPEDFDPTDRKQMQALLTHTAQQSVQHALGVVFKPVQLAMKTMADQTLNAIDKKIGESQKTNSAKSLLQDYIPEVNNPEHSGLIQAMDKQLRSKNKKPMERVKLIRAMLNQMGVKAKPGQRRSSNGQGSPDSRGITVNHGAAALDSFFGAFKPPGKK